MPAQTISNAFKVEVDGKALPAGVDLASVEIEDHLHLPDAFNLTIRDGPRTALASMGVKIGSKVKVAVLSDASPSPTALIDGEVTAIEVELHSGTSYSVVRGYDASHRLHRGRVTSSYLNMTYADVAQKVAQRHGLTAQVESTSPTYPHITQAAESDWSFLRRLAREVGYEVTVADGTLHFRKPAPSESAPGNGDLRTEDPLRLLAGSTLLYLRSSVSAAEQVKEVEVRGWDPARKEAVVATATTETDVVKNGSSSADVAKAFPAPSIVTSNLPLTDRKDKEVELAAKSLADVVASNLTEVEGQARGNPKLRAGVAIQIGLLGDPFDGKYVLTSTRHRYDPDEGYVVWFVVTGRTQRSTLALASGGSDTGMPGAIAGAVPAIVDDVDDPDRKCRVRVRFPWLSEGYVSDWSRVTQVGAGEDRGLVVLPEVGDEVLVAFDHGDLRRPYVLGGLYNDKDTPNVGPGSLIDGSSKSVNNRLFTSRKGHQLLFVDAESDLSVVLQSADKKLVVTLDQSNRKITIASGGDLEIKVDGDIKMEAKGSIEMKGASISAEAQSSWKAKGATASLEGSGPVTVKGQPIQLN